jgi:FAD/FMN-containing dehydrogenase
MPQLFSPNPKAIGFAKHTPQRDRAPDGLAMGTSPRLRDDLIGLLGADRVLSRPIDLIRYAADASPYRLFPKVIVIACTVADVRKLLEYARQNQETVTFRGAGTSLSGQAQSDGILVDVRQHWAGMNIENGGRRLRVRPGTILSRANLALISYGYRLGPDPASASACTIGGVIANNSSGMCCGTTQNAYKTLSSLTFMLPSGTLIDTARDDAEQAFAAAEPALAAGLIEIKREIEADAELAARLRKKFSIKSTTGYHMEAFLDGVTPLEIFRRLIVGSEGTLAFIAEAVFDTVADDQYRLTSLMIFPDMYAACAAVKPFVDHGAAAVELLDRASLRSVEGKPGVPDRWKALPANATALLVEFRAADEAARSQAWGECHIGGLEPAEFTRDPHLAAQFWNVRSGLLASVGGARPSGSSFILEDVCFLPERLADGALDLQALFSRHGYEGIVFGHASAGNLHFLITPFLNDPTEIAHYDAFMQDLVQLVVGKYDGSLKAEHGTGRNVAPFVEREWGSKLAGLMWKLKRLADPHGILAPGVMLTQDPQGHLKNLQTSPTIEASAAIRTGNAAAAVFGSGAMSALTSAARAIVSKDLVPGWLPNMPPAASATMPTTSRENAAAVYFTACVNRIFGRASGKKRALSLQDAMVTVASRAGMPLWIPDDITGHCCATIWHSKGYHQGNVIMANRITEALWEWSDGSRLPVVCDASSCSLGITREIVDCLTPENRAHHAQLRIVDSIAWAHDELLPKLVIRRKLKSAVLHPSCSASHLKLVPKMAALVAAIANEAIMPAAHAAALSLGTAASSIPN